MTKSLIMLIATVLWVAIPTSSATAQTPEFLQKFWELPEYENNAAEPFEIDVAMSDGTQLKTHVHLPVGDGPWPAIVIRDPYSQNRVFCRIFSRYGFACVHQDVRGRYNSGGEWHPVVNERQDGLETLRWVLDQKWQDGNLATYGGSYVGMVQWAMLDEMPSEVKTMIADVSHGDWYQIVHRNGHFVHGVMTPWALSLHNSEFEFEDVADTNPMIIANDEYLYGQADWYQDYLVNDEKTSQYWNQEVFVKARTAHRATDIPVLMIGGWHDFFIRGQIQKFEEHGARDQSVLFIRNGSHGVGSIAEFREMAKIAVRRDLNWLNRHLKHDGDIDFPASGYVFQNNLDKSFAEHEHWPENSGWKRLHINALDKAHNCDGGELTELRPHGEQSASYTYDPKSPVPSIGGAYHLSKPGVVSQGNSNCERTDVLSFATEEIEDAFLINGSVNVQLDVSSTAEDSAFTVKLQEVRADGQVLNIRDDITSLEMRNGRNEPNAYTPGEKVWLEFDLTPIRWTTTPGSKLRLDISSSNFPMYNAHPNISENWATVDQADIATQTLFRGRVSIPTH